MNSMNRMPSRCWRPTSGRILIPIGLLLALVTPVQAETFSGYGSGSDEDYGEACRLAGDDYLSCSGTLTLGDCNCKKEESDEGYYWSCSVKWTCTTSSESDTDESDNSKKSDADDNEQSTDES